MIAVLRCGANPAGVWQPGRAVPPGDAQIFATGVRLIGVGLAGAIAEARPAEIPHFDAMGKSVGAVRAIDEVDAKYNKR